MKITRQWQSLCPLLFILCNLKRKKNWANKEGQAYGSSYNNAFCVLQKKDVIVKAAFLLHKSEVITTHEEYTSNSEHKHVYVYIVVYLMRKKESSERAD